MNNIEKREALLTKAEELLARRPFSKQLEAEFNSTLLLADSFNDGARRERIASVMGAEARNTADEAEVQFRNYTRTSEKRSYSALNVATGSQGGYLVPTKWKAEYQTRLTSASGWLKAGATVVDGPAIGGNPYLSFFSDDQANQAEILTENTAFASTPLVVASVKTPVVFKFSSASLVSSELTDDIAFDLDRYLKSLFAVRVARKFNNFASVDSTYGLFSQLTVGATTASTTVPTIVELTNMQTAIDYGYREDGAVYMLSPGMEAVLKQQVGTSGNKTYPEMADQKLLGYNYVVNVDQPYAAASVGVVFGSFRRAILVQSVNPILLRSVERYAELSQVFYAFFHRMGVKLVDANAVTALKMHA
jgi:HK97 family phage major capsid protein